MFFVIEKLKTTGKHVYVFSLVRDKLIIILEKKIIIYFLNMIYKKKQYGILNMKV